MNSSARIAEMLQRERKSPPRFLWANGVDPVESQRRRLFLIHRRKPRFTCEIKINAVIARELRAPVIGYWFTQGPVKYWACDEFIAYEFECIDPQPADELLDGILMSAVPSFRQYQQQNQERSPKSAQQTEAPAAPVRKYVH